MERVTADDMVKRPIRKRKRADVTHQQRSSVGNRPRFGEIVDREIEANRLFVPPSQRGEQNTRPAAAIEDCTVWILWQTREKERIDRSVIVQGKVQTVAQFLSRDEPSLLFNLFQYAAHRRSPDEVRTDVCAVGAFFI